MKPLIYGQKTMFDTDFLVKDLLKEKDICYTLKNEIAPLIKDTDFSDMYSNKGRIPISPKILLLTTIMQFLERLPDRAAADNLRFRLDWKIAFSLPIEFEGIHPTTLVYFRDRLEENEKASIVFDKILEHLKETGLVKKNKKQRIDSTHIIGNVRELSRIELLHETLRLFVRKSFKHFTNPNENILNLNAYYSEKISVKGISNAQKDKMISEAGLAMKSFIIYADLPTTNQIIHDEESFNTLKTVFEQNFTDSDNSLENEPKLKKIATGKGHICSPHDTDARYANKGGKGWSGYKAQIVETINEDKEDVNFITHIEANEATDYDGHPVQNIIDELADKEVEPNELYGDTHYNTTDNIKKLKKERDIDLKGTVAPDTRKKTKSRKGFRVDYKEKKVICPEGVTSRRFNDSRKNYISATFPKDKCNICERKNICNPEKRGKQFVERKNKEFLNQRRKEMKTKEFKEDMYKRNGIEGTISGLVRGQSFRRARFRGKSKMNLQAKFTGAAANVSRLHRQRIIDSKNKLLCQKHLATAA